MAYTGCDCGVGLWDGYVPGGVNWDIFPKWQAEAAISKHPEYGIADVGDYISETYDNDEFIEVWLCRRCRRIQIRDQYPVHMKSIFLRLFRLLPEMNDDNVPFGDGELQRMFKIHVTRKSNAKSIAFSATDDILYIISEVYEWDCSLNGTKKRKRIILSNMELTLKQRVMCFWIRIDWSFMMRSIVLLKKTGI